MNVLDVGIVALDLAALTFGFARGFWLTFFEYVGVVLGFTGGALAAPFVIARLPLDASPLRIVAVLLLLCGGAILGSAAAHVAGDPLRRVAHVVRLVGLLDNLAGAVLTAAVTLATVWYLGLSLSNGPSPALAQLVLHSIILQRLDRVAPVPPPALTRLQEVLSGQLLPQLFAGLEPPLPGVLAPDPASVSTPGVHVAAASTVKVEAPGCGGVNFGSGFVIAPDRVLTNAHVVSGTRSVSVVAPNGRAAMAGRVMSFDPERDVAVISVPRLGLPVLSAGDGRRGTPAIILGYPGGGAETAAAGVIEGSVHARGRDIYDRNDVTREIWVIGGQARPGNSGGPLVDEAGHFLGVVFAGSVSHPGQSYALAPSEVAAAMEAASGTSAAIDTRGFGCVS